ncbi:fimbrin/plastin, partial [Reticulomyxa filosa]
LNLAFTAQLFNTAPALEPLKDEEQKELAGLMDDDANGLTLLKVIDKIEPGTVLWKKVEMKPNNKFKKLGNCKYAIVLGKQLKLSL